MSILITFLLKNVQMVNEEVTCQSLLRAKGLTGSTEKLVTYFRLTFFFWQIELDELNRTQNELKRGSEKLQDILQKLEREQVTARNMLKLCGE